MSNPISSRDVAVGEHRLRLYESGNKDRPPVLWLHGSGPGVDAMANWETLMTGLAGDYYNIAPDIIGFGESSCPDPFPRGVGASVEFRARNTLALLDALGLDAVHAVGNSMGGMITLRMAQFAPARLRKIVLMGSGGAPIGLTPQAAARTRGFITNPSAEALADLMKTFVYDEEALGVDIDEVAKHRIKLAFRPDIARVNASTFDMSLPGVEFTPEELAAIQHETLAIHGREDYVVPPEASHYLAKHLPNAQLHVFPKSGHWAQLEQPARFKALIQAFISGAL